MRIERVLAGVVRQACADAGAQRLEVIGRGPAAGWARSICAAAVGPDAVGQGGLTVHTASKTGLLLGEDPIADVLLFGDLYYSQVTELAGGAVLPPEVEDLAGACGGAALLDAALARYFDERASWEAAAAGLPPSAGALLWEALERARFRRLRTGLVPKLGARTLGIDLYA